MLRAHASRGWMRSHDPVCVSALYWRLKIFSCFADCHAATESETGGAHLLVEHSLELCITLPSGERFRNRLPVRLAHSDAPHDAAPRGSIEGYFDGYSEGRDGEVCSWRRCPAQAAKRCMLHYEVPQQCISPS